MNNKSIAEKVLINTNEAPSIPKGCKIVKHIEAGKISFYSLQDLVISDQFNQLAVTVMGRLVNDKTITLANATILDYWLKNQKIIPKKYKKEGLCFWGTVFQGDEFVFIKELAWIPAEKRYDWRKIDIFSNYVHNQPAAVIR